LKNICAHETKSNPPIAKENFKEEKEKSKFKEASLKKVWCAQFLQAISCFFKM
jgi:hypothetical protein